MEFFLDIRAPAGVRTRDPRDLGNYKQPVTNVRRELTRLCHIFGPC